MLNKEEADKTAASLTHYKEISYIYTHLTTLAYAIEDVRNHFLSISYEELRDTYASAMVNKIYENASALYAIFKLKGV